MKPIDQDDVSFHGHEQAAQRLPLRDGSQARRPCCRRRQGACREARPQRSVPVRLHEVVSSAAACAVAAFDGVNRDHYRR